MSAKKYICAGRIFDSLAAACDYAGFVFKVSGYVVAVEEVPTC
jgi:hypothetical protein